MGLLKRYLFKACGKKVKRKKFMKLVEYFLFSLSIFFKANNFYRELYIIFIWTHDMMLWLEDRRLMIVIFVIVWRSEGPCLLLWSSMISRNIFECWNYRRRTSLFEFITEIVEKFSFNPQNVECSRFSWTQARRLLSFEDSKWVTEGRKWRFWFIYSAWCDQFYAGLELLSSWVLLVQFLIISFAECNFISSNML